MRFPYLAAARVKLQERKNTCLRADYRAAEGYVAHLLAFMKRDPIFRPIAAELELRAHQEFSDVAKCVDVANGRLNLPAAEADCPPFYYRLLQAYASTNPNDVIPNFMRIFARSSAGIAEKHADFLNQTLVPLCSHLDERIDDGDMLLYTLCRFQRECSWFERSRLMQLANEADSRQLEEVLDRELRAWLFREGIDFPFEKPGSPAGITDIVVWHQEEPLPVEVKVFDRQNRDAGHVSQGLWQAFRYSQDYGKQFGYLVVFNISNAILSFDGSDPGAALPTVTVGDRTVFVIVVNLHPDVVTASKERPLATVRIAVPSGPTAG